MQFPFTLAWAATGHTMQGVTFKTGSGAKLVIHWNTFPAGMAYVMLGRVETIHDMFIVGDFDPGEIKADEEAKNETERLKICRFKS